MEIGEVPAVLKTGLIVYNYKGIQQRLGVTLASVVSN